MLRRCIGAAGVLLPREHRLCLALEVKVRFAAHIDRDAVDRPAGEPMGRLAGVVLGDRHAAVATDAEALTGQLEVSGLRLDPPLPDLLIALIQRRDPGGDARRVLAILLER